MNGSGRFSGVAKINSAFDKNKNFGLWAINETWKGLFSVEWIFIKDILNQHLKNIRLR
jgi:hypothetical protein